MYIGRWSAAGAIRRKILDAGFGRYKIIRSMNCREEELVAEMKKYWVEVLQVNEMKVRGNGVKQIEDVSCIVSGLQEGRVNGGVAILLAERFGRYLEVC